MGPKDTRVWVKCRNLPFLIIIIYVWYRYVSRAVGLLRNDIDDLNFDLPTWKNGLPKTHDAVLSFVLVLHFTCFRSDCEHQTPE